MHLAGISANRGMRPVLLLDEPWHEDFTRWTSEADAVIIDTPAHSHPSRAAYEKTRRAIRLLGTIDPQLLQVKYGSNFDPSAAHGIACSIDAAMDETDEPFTIALPSCSVKNDIPSGARVAYLQAETKRKVGLLAHPDVAQGEARIRQKVAQLRTDGVEIAVVDCTSEQDLPNVCAAVSDLRLITGSAGLACHLPASWQESSPVYPQRRAGGRGMLIVAGSCSPVTRQQNTWLTHHNAIAITLQASNLAAGTMPDSALTPLCEELASGGTCILQTSTDVESVHDYFRAQNKSEHEIGESIARCLATFVRDVLSFITPEGLIVAGEQTADILSQVLGFGALAAGPTIEPGIPVCVTLSGSSLPVVLKSGNAGSEHFYRHAIETIRSLEYLA